MKETKKRIAKVFSFLVIVSIVFVMVQNYFPAQIIKDRTEALENKQLQAAQVGTIDNWMYRIDSYAARIGRRLGNGNQEQKWLFHDTNNEYNNLYCIQSGNAQAEKYIIYDLYSFNDDEAMIKKYFGNRETYNHFMWILENMYLVNQTNSSKTYMEDQLLTKMGAKGNHVENSYRSMPEELQRYYNNAGVSSDGYTEYFTAYKYNGKARVASSSKYAVDGRDNFIKTIQNYLLLSYSIQRGNGYGLSPLDSNGNIILDIKSYSNDGSAVSETIGNDTASKKFIHQLLLYLVNGYKSDSYKVEKYKNFENDAYANTGIVDSKAKYDTDSHRVGPFYLNNKYGFKISLSNVSYGNRVFNNNEYKIVDSKGNAVNLSEAATGKEFFVEVQPDFAKNTKDSMKVSWNVDFGEVPEAKIFVPTTGTTTQVLIDVERTHRTKNGEYSDVIPDLKADIALKKYIYSVNGNKVADRLGSIDLINLKNNAAPHTATYNMNKTPVDVNVGDTVTYAIRLFNEGEIEGTATKITDHLPNYLTFVKAYDANGSELEVIKTNYDKDITITTKLENMKAYSSDDTEKSFKEKSQVIYVDCKVSSNDGIQKVYTNMAEIAEYRFETGSDIDSKATNWSIGTTARDDNKWIDYTNNQDNWLDNELHPFVGQEDDDDFDKIRVRNIDLALTKRIEGKLTSDGNEEYLIPEDSATDKSRLEISGYEDVKLGKATDLQYNMNKKPAIVSRGDRLVTSITVFNEGSVDGVVKQITDYLPAGLNFNEEESKKLNPNVEFNYNKSSRYLLIKLNGDEGVSLKNLNLFDNYVDRYVVRIVTDVDKSANGRLYNSAQITDYGYIGIDGDYYGTNELGVDRDSTSSTSGNTVVSKHRAGYLTAEMMEFDLTKFDKNMFQHEDDDDVDAVEVVYNADFDLSLRKYVYKVEKNFKGTDGNNYTITYPERVPAIDSKSMTALKNEGTAEYYHDKLKVNVETGDTVTYRIRVYNEGLGEAYDGRATQVTDYLPQGVEFIGLEEGYDKEWKATQNGQIITFDYVGKKIIPANSMDKLVQNNRGKVDETYFQEIGVVCKVTADSTMDGKALTNRAAITGDEAYDDFELVEGVTDKDSKSEDLTDPELDTWYENTVTNEDTPEEYYPGEEDDDDFDTIYVNNYSVKVVKTNGTDNLPGVDLKVLKYREISNPAQTLEKKELTEIETAVKENAEGTYKTSTPTTNVEKDVYIIKEIKTVEGYENQFEGKYIKFTVVARNGSVALERRNIDGSPLSVQIYEDNGDDDYTNDVALKDDFRDPYNIYDYVKYEYLDDNEISIKIINTEVRPSGEFNVKLYKVDEEGKLITDYSARFQGHRHNGKINIKKIDATTEKGIAIIDENVQITDVNDQYQYQIAETEAPEGYEKELRLLVLNAKFKQVEKKYVLDTERTTFNYGSDILPASNKDVEFDDNTGAAWFIDEETATINIYLKNKKIVPPSGEFNVKLYKVDEEGNLISDYNAKFKGFRHNGKINIKTIDVTTEKGIATIDEKVVITDVNDQYLYQLNETEAPEGYEKEQRTLALKVNFKQVENRYVIDSENTIFNLGSDVIPASSENGKFVDNNGAAWYLDEETATINIYLKNKEEVKPEGKFNVNLYKVDEDGNLITDYSARFVGTRHNGKINIKNIDVKTEKGVATIDKDVEITDVNDHYQYQIKETEAPEGYEKELRLLVLNVDFKQVDKKYVIDTEKTSFNLGSDKLSLSDKDGYAGENDASWFINEETATINVYLKNKEEVKPEGKFNVKLYKVDQDGNLITDYSARFQGMRHNGKVNVKNIDVKTEKGLAIIDENVEITDVNDQYLYQLNESEAPEGYEKEQRTLALKVNFKQVENKYVLDRENTIFNFGSDVVAASSKDGEFNNTSAAWFIDEETATINIYLKNSPKLRASGRFSVKLYKVDEEGKLVTDYSARFQGMRHNGKINVKNIDVKTEKGIAIIDENVQITDVNDQFQYQLSETEAPEGYEKELRLLVLKANFKQEGSKYLLDKENTIFNLGSDVIPASSKDGEFTGDNDAAWYIDEETATISIYLKNKQTVKIPNKFDVVLYKVDENGNIITDYSAKFTGFRHSGKINIKNISVNTENGIAEIDKGVEINDVNDSYKYQLSEEEAPLGYEKINELLVLTTKFKSVDDEIVLDSESTVFNFGSTAVPQSENAGEFIGDNKASWFIDENTATINIYLKNNKITKGFDINLVKTRDGKKTPLAGATFKITIDDGRGNVIAEDNLVTNKEGRIPTISGIQIDAADVTYTITVEEIKAPEGYIGLEVPVTFTAKSKVEDNVYVLEPVENSTLENEARVSREIKADEIYIAVENRGEPVIHKGVKTVENQDSGYDKNEIQTWVINTTVPYGIKDYTKYVVTDTIDFKKVKVEEKRIEFINEDKPEENVVVKYKGTDTVLEEGKDYYVYFDKETKVLVVTFINNDFGGGKTLTEGSTIEITYNTKFVLDVDGNIVGINQEIPNTSHLTFSVNGQEDKTKKSETPEVHTGGVGVFKFDEVSGKALEGAHFKIARSSEDAKNGKFIKVRDENGNETDEDYEVISDANGHASFVGLEFGEDALNKVESSKHPETGATVYNYDWSKVETTYFIVETEAPEEYNKITDVVPAVVKAENYDNIDLTKYIEIGNRPKEYDLALRKYITNVKAYDHDGNVIDRNITDREPRVTLTDEFKDKNNKDVTTAIYEHTKEPVIVQQGNIVTYNIRVYNEGPENAYAALVKDDIPEGTEFVAYTEGDGSINDKYNWRLLDAEGNETSDLSKAKFIITDYLANGEENLIKAFNPETMNELDSRTVQVQFRVTEPNTSERILTNYAQISQITNGKGKVVTDRDSTPDEWNEGEDDQDIENIKLLYFDLALRKWVTKAIVYENGQEVVYETGHKAEDDPEDVVKVDLKKSKIKNIVVKFEYQIRVTNEGKIGGSALEVTDHIPDGLIFDEADNTIWTKVDENTIATDALKDVYLEPGESAEVTVVLRWVNSASNLGIKNNIAEISKDYNEYGVADIDSTPGNYKWGEDDIDDAPVMLAIKTGSIATQAIALGVAVLFIVVFGIKRIKKSFKEI